MTNNNFLPDSYEVPAGGNGGYMKFKEGANTFRALSRPVIGWVGWLDDKTPIRVRNEAELNDKQLRERPKHFWAFVVWNYQTQAIEVLEISQATIQRALEALINNQSWGSPFNYDITVTRTGAALDTAYMVAPSPPSPIAKPIEEALIGTPVNLELLFINDDPFKTTGNHVTASAPLTAQAYAEQSQPITPQAPPMPGFDPNQRGPLFDENGNQVN